ncbi:MAG: aldo/keto reductase [Eggerthellaceae bacterium]|nr:aldo/keto reductase [Eggerthellaceae bacterium]
MILGESYTLSNGVVIPRLGFGTWLISDDKVTQPVLDAIKIGYRLIDTAEAYGNERGVGEAIRTCGLMREELFVSTKLEADIKTYECAKAAIDESLKKMDIDYLDMMLINAPEPWDSFHENARKYDEGNREAWRALEENVKAGNIRCIGISNFEEMDIDNILNTCTINPVVNQILVHVMNTPKNLIDFTNNQDIKVEAYSPIGHGEILNNPELVAMAKKYGVSVAQLCIRYTLQLGCISLPKASTPEHIKQNTEVDFEISKEDMQTLLNMPQIKGYGDASKYAVYDGRYAS